MSDEVRFPNLFLVGAPKCGTSSLAYWLGQHPMIFAPIEKEPGYFGSDLIFSGARTSVSRYAEHYLEWESERYALDATPSYFVSEMASREIYSVRPDARIVVILRNPVDAIHSNFHHARYRLTESLETLEEALDAEPRRRLQCEVPNFGVLQSTFYTEIYRYRRNITRYLEAFGGERVHVLLLDDFRSTPRRMLSRLFEVLGVDPGHAHQIDLAVKNESGRARFRAVSRLAIHPPKWAGQIASPFMPPKSRQRIRLWLRSLNTRPEKNPPLLLETRRRLTTEFRPEIEWLADYLDRDLSHWLSCE